MSLLNQPITTCTAFQGTRCIASGSVPEVLAEVKKVLDRDRHAPVLIFDDATSELMELDLQGSSPQIMPRADKTDAVPGMDEPPSRDQEAKRPGRPKLGVVAREVTLLPRHWEWLATQPGGASVVLRKLVEQASKASRDQDRVRRARGNLPVRFDDGG